jgi:hypothetical protein
MTQTMLVPCVAGAYTAGDEISSSQTAGSVVRPIFDLSGFSRGRVLAASVDVTPASVNVVIVAFNFNMILFKTASVPAAVGDNVTFPLTGAQRRAAIGHFLFDDGGWVNTLGAFTAGTSAFQATPATMSVPLATPAIAAPHVPGYFFEFTQGEARSLTAALQVLAAWTPLAVNNTFGINLDLEVE